MKKRRIIKGFAIITALFVALAVLYFSLIKYLNGEPQIMLNKQQAQFIEQCGEQHSQQYLDSNGVLNLAVWNIFKQKRSHWQQELSKLVQSHQLILLQEAKLNNGLHDFVNSIEQHALMAKAFKLFNTPVGVMNLSQSRATQACVYTEVEPYIRFAKSSLVAEYPLSNGQSLLVVNLHGINFDFKLHRFDKQINLVFTQLEHHQGPVIFAGDFNTWSLDRLSIIQQLAKRHHLVEVSYDVDVRTRIFGLPLDHIYYRGMNLIQSKSVNSSASDHTPITAKFKIER
ncbi:endonuclease/exonuclease/phosphatase family protein [Shewanella maritima]|uniref:Endonuclease/exonuclease/phosphatase family protein n=1 Tax=Shewanella maritima TaxID=2520507 RepID=A0A411PM47_9GAMM|nr:endonuclease/exonuclease/phosphatase family protein [Shewanella maritima]QBF84620.1 endonuclease/exonuclease/phosphatase family protein [Shewanella maritima]